jgi:hypothetical protein
MCASAIKYDWLGPDLLRRAAQSDQQVGYGGVPIRDIERLFRERASALAFLAGWADEARRLAVELGVT